MSLNSLQQFARQLCAWGNEYLQSRPGPFRGVEAFPTLLEVSDPDTPVIVFWVNRDSHLAGGVLLLPKKDPTAVIDQGREICAALGLDCYYTWGVAEVAAWRVDSEPGRIWTEPLPHAAALEARDFRETLALLLQQMQQHFFLAQADLPRQSSAYLTNLLANCVESCIALVPANTNGLDGRRTIIGLIVQILALLSQGLLPARLTAANLTEELARVNSRLPAELAKTFELSADTALPDAVSVRLHLLCQRLQQLCPEIITHIPPSLTRLLREWAALCSLAPLPAPLRKGRSALIINPDRCHPEMAVAIEVAPQPIPAATALLRLLQSSARKHPLQFTDPMQIAGKIEDLEVIGTLNDPARIAADEQKRLQTLLRRSWPNRQLKLAATPRWGWQLAHIIGLLKGETLVTLDLPADWLWAPYGEQLFALLGERLTLTRVAPCTERGIRIECRQLSEKPHCRVEAVTGAQRQIEKQTRDLTRAELLLALTLPDHVYELIRCAELELPEAVPDKPEALRLFALSTIGQGLWKILNPRKSVAKCRDIVAEVARIGLPLPSEKALQALARLADTGVTVDTATIDRALEVWLGPIGPDPIQRYFALDKQQLRPIGNTAKTAIAQSVDQPGEIPAFPGDYLYDIPHRDLQHYTVSGPLQVSDSFFNTVTLTTADGEQIDVDGLMTARALQLFASFQTGECTLPADDRQTGRILERYLNDLRRLEERIRKESAQLDASGTEQLVEQVWAQLPLPPRQILATL